MSPEEWLASQPKQATPAAPATPTAAPMSPEQWLATQTLKPSTTPSTTATGLAGGLARGMAPVAAGAAIGAAAGLPFAGVGAVPGAIAGAGAAALTQLVGDPIISTINSLLGTKYTLPTDAMEDFLTRVGVAKPRTEAERIVQATTAGASLAGGTVAAARAIKTAAASPVTQRVAGLLAKQPALQITSGAAAGGGGQATKETGAGTAAQIAASLAAGMTPFGVAAAIPAVRRLATTRPVTAPPRIEPTLTPEAAPTSAAMAPEAPPVAPAVAAIPEAPPAAVTPEVPPAAPPVTPVAAAVVPEVSMTAEELTATTRKATEGGFGSNRATKILATQAAPDPKVLEAARRLNIEGYLQPDHLTSNQAYRELAQAVKSIPGSQARAAEIAGLEQVGKRADDLITQIGGMTDLSRMNQAVRTNLSQTVSTLESKADDAYAQLRANIPADSTGQADNVLNFIEQRVRNLGGDPKNLSPLEQSIRTKLTPKPIKDDQGNVIGTRPPTYTLIDDVRKDTGAAAREKGQFKDADTGAAKNLYKLIDDDQFNLAEAFGRGEQYRAAKSLVAMRKGLEDDMVSLFGKQLDQSLVSKLSTATSSLSKGDAEQLAKILTAIPKDMRKTVAASALNTAFGKATQTGTLNFNTYANWYQGLMENKQAYAALMSNLPQSSRKALSDLYRVSDNVRKASRERITTGRIQSVQQELQGVDSLLNNVFTLAKRSAIGVPIEAVTASLGLPGAGLAAGLTSALSKGVKPEVIKKADELIASPEFQRLVIETTTEAASAATIRRAAMSQSFQKFADAAKLPKAMDARIQWLQSAIQTERQFDQENQ